MFLPYLLVLLPALIHARISIDIEASENGDVRFSGQNVDIISDTERNTFGLNDDFLKRASRAYFGERPNDVYVRSPTPWGDLYQSYGWRQVTRTLTPESARILKISEQASILATKVFHNNSTKTAEFNAQISQTVQNTVSSSWEKSGDLTVGQDIEYGIDIEVASASGKTSIAYTTRWGESTLKSESVTVGANSGVTISLKPNEKIVAELYATRGTMMIEVNYIASLSGALAVNYDPTYRGHHFWALGVNEVMKAGGMKNMAKSREVITLGFYSKAHVVIKDAQSNKMLYSIPLKMNLY